MEIEALQAILMDEFSGLCLLWSRNVASIWFFSQLYSSKSSVRWLCCLMDHLPEIDSRESGLSTDGRCFQILLSPQVILIISLSFVDPYDRQRWKRQKSFLPVLLLILSLWDMQSIINHPDQKILKLHQLAFTLKHPYHPSLRLPS